MKICTQEWELFRRPDEHYNCVQLPKLGRTASYCQVKSLLKTSVALSQWKLKWEKLNTEESLNWSTDKIFQ
jgi:hypothetical protein